MKQRFRIIYSLLILFLASHQALDACSMVKLTSDGCTFVGNNEDAWRTTSKIIFEQGGDDTYGVAFLTHREKEQAQGAMNTAGLCFDVFTVLPKASDHGENRSPNSLVNEIMRTCSTVHEVKAKLEPYQTYFYPIAMFLFVDKSGDYLIIEPDTLILGSEPKYHLVNFCPSITPDLNAVKMSRYHRGTAYLADKSTASLDVTLGAMDTMHECRGKLGDGTLYTNIYDLDKSEIHLYFYHDYSRSVTFNLEEELAKGDHSYPIDSLFPENAEFEKLRSYQTPRSSKVIFGFFFLSTGLYVLTILSFAISILIGLFRKKDGTKSNSHWAFKLLMMASSVAFIFYLINAYRFQAMFYFPAPYKAIDFPLLSAAAYLPFVLLLGIGPLIWFNWKVLKQHTWSKFMKFILSMNTLSYAVLLVLFGYWGFLVFI